MSILRDTVMVVVALVGGLVQQHGLFREQLGSEGVGEEVEEHAETLRAEFEQVMCVLMVCMGDIQFGVIVLCEE